MRKRIKIKTGFILGAIIIGCLWTALALAEDDYQPVYNPTMEVSRKAGDIKIDGDLGDPGWSGAARAGRAASAIP